MKTNIHNVTTQTTTLQTRLAPQVVANIKLLALNNEQLLTFLQHEIAINPLLELVIDEDNPQTEESLEQLIEQLEAADNDSPDNNDVNNCSALEQIIPITATDATSLHSQLEWQAQLAAFSELELAIAMVIIDSINDQGFLTASFAQIAATLKLDAADLTTIAHVHNKILAFEPIGIGARDAKEYLLYQLTQSAPQHHAYALAYNIVQQALIALSQHDLKKIKQITKASYSTIQDAIKLIISLPPYPAANYVYQTLPLINEPDLYTIHHNNELQLRLNPRVNYNISIDAAYERIVQEQGQNYPQMQLQLKHAKLLQQGLYHRQHSLLLVAECILKEQIAFFTLGVAGLKPLNLTDLSQKIGLHISSISRIIQNKTIHTPRGLYELCYFLTAANQDTAATTTRACHDRIKLLINNESKEKPYSDEVLRQQLTEQGINISRRAISKYRQQLGIAAAHLRKKLTRRYYHAN